MTLIIQRAEDRDTQALQAKLDELLRVTTLASDALTKIDTLEPEEIKRFRDQVYGRPEDYMLHSKQPS
jgi:low affinity Fe/Cu permease